MIERSVVGRGGVGRRRRRAEDDGLAALALFAAAVAVVASGAVGAAQRLVERWWPLLAAAGVALVVGLALLAWRARARRRAEETRQRLLDAQVGSTDAMSAKGFELLVARLLRRDGWLDVQVSGGAGDLGADVTARGADGRRLVVQCKRYAPHNLVGSPDVQRFLGTVWHEHHADLAWFVTTSGFTRPAADLGRRRGVVLVGRPELAAWMARDTSRSGADRPAAPPP